MHAHQAAHTPNTPLPPGVRPLALRFRRDPTFLDLDRNNLVVPAVIARAMPVAFEAQLDALLSQVRTALPQLEVPTYRVETVRRQPLYSLSPKELQAAGIIADLDETTGGVRYYRRDHREQSLDRTMPVWVRYPDPLLENPPQDSPTSEPRPLAKRFQRDRSFLDLDRNNLVLPAAIARAMPLEWEARMDELLSQARATHPQLFVPIYRVETVRLQPLHALSPDELRASEIVADSDEATGDVRYYRRDRPQRFLDLTTPVWVRCPDPLLECPPQQP